MLQYIIPIPRVLETARIKVNFQPFASVTNINDSKVSRRADLDQRLYFCFFSNRYNSKQKSTHAAERWRAGQFFQMSEPSWTLQQAWLTQTQRFSMDLARHKYRWGWGGRFQSLSSPLLEKRQFGRGKNPCSSNESQNDKKVLFLNKRNF